MRTIILSILFTLAGCSGAALPTQDQPQAATFTVAVTCNDAICGWLGYSVLGLDYTANAARATATDYADLFAAHEGGGPVLQSRVDMVRRQVTAWSAAVDFSTTITVNGEEFTIAILAKGPQ